MSGRFPRHDESREACDRRRLGQLLKSRAGRGPRGLGAFVAGDAAAAVEWLEPAVEMIAEGGVRHPNFFRTDPELVEAFVRLGRAEQAEAHLARL